MRHPSGSPRSPLRLYGSRIMLRPLMSTDFEAWSEVRTHNEDWLVPWEPKRHPLQGDPVTYRAAFVARCNARDRDRSADYAYAFGVFVNQRVAGEINLNGIVRGAMQTGTMGYWIDQRQAGHGYITEGVAVVLKFAFEDLHLHRVEICIVPRNSKSRRVVEKLGIRCEGLAERFLEINGVWEDHLRFAITAEEWAERREDFAAWW